jgi:hypothetical protein
MAIPIRFQPNEDAARRQWLGFKGTALAGMYVWHIDPSTFHQQLEHGG